jgi:hypothetical protein
LAVGRRELPDLGRGDADGANRLELGILLEGRSALELQKCVEKFPGAFGWVVC